ncbi:U4/U6 small nuclear ribonucleoprotein PRP31 [Pseudohyphozyma bogoriensis]|nr:U4/U6 small nuclear ribonucleoprotein PRP31 [Pseudohyphozyma bogoriensis]
MTSLADELENELFSDNESDGELDALAAAGPSDPLAAPGEGDVAMEDDDDDAGLEIEMGGQEGEVMVPEGGVRPAEELNIETVNEMALGGVSEVGKVAKLMSGKTLNEVLKNIEYYKVNPDDNIAADSDSAEYKLIVQANNLSVEIDNEMLIVHKFIKDHYLPRFPELDSLVSSPLPFCEVILALGNNEELRGDISKFLPSGSVMAVTVTAATTKGVPLDPKEWKVVTDAVAMMKGLASAKDTILDYVQSRISLLAPNISEIVGTTTATKILGIAGGLQGLSRIPHSNIYVLGAVKRASTGFSNAAHSVDRLHTGFIYQCPLVQSARMEDRMKAQRKVGAKVALAVRVDIAGSSPGGEFGLECVEKLERELERLAAPTKLKTIKALPRPDEKKKNRRGGKRARKAKEAYAMTELRKQQNRMKFGEAEEETGAYDETMGLGMIGSSSGKIRANAGEARSKAKMSKANKGRLAAFKSSQSGTATSGLASSLAFTPVQGLELIDPSRARAKASAANDSWFGDGAFTHVKKEKGIGKPSNE